MFKITESPEQNRTEATMFRRAVDNAGLDLAPFDPEALPAPTWSPATAQQISEAAFAVASKGKDPSQDKTVRDLLISKLLGDTIGGLHWRHDLALTKAELEHYAAQAPALIEQAATIYQDAVDAMTDALDLIGPVDLTDALTNGRLRPQQAEAAIRARTASTHAQAIATALPLLAEAAGQPLGTGPQWARLTWTQPSLSQFIEYKMDGRNDRRDQHGTPFTPWNLLCDGVPLTLATTPDEVRQRIARLERAEADSYTDHNAVNAARELAAAQRTAFI